MTRKTATNLVLAALALALGGCAFERADPAARSNRANYTITVTATGGSTATAYISDGLMATADGAGAITQPSTQTTTQSPEFAGGADPISAGIRAIGSVATAGINAYTASKSGAAKTAPDLPAPTAAPEATGDDCADGSCDYDAGDCTGDACEYQ